MKDSRRQIIVSKIANSQLSILENKNTQNHKQPYNHHSFKNDFNRIKSNNLHLSHSHQQNQPDNLEDQDEEIIQSMKQKQRLLKELKDLKPQVRKPKAKQQKTIIKNNKSSSTKHSQVIINTINSSEKKLNLVSSGQKKISSINSKPNKNLMFNSLSVKKVSISNSKKHLLNQNNIKIPHKSQNQTVRKSEDSVSSSKPDIFALKKLLYDPEILLRSPHKSQLVKRKHENFSKRTNQFGSPENIQSYSGNFQIKDNSQQIPYRFHY